MFAPAGTAGVAASARLSWWQPTDRRPRRDHMKIPTLIVCALLAVTGCASFSGSGRDDAFCGEMIKFANATPLSSQHSVELLTNWPEWSKSCQHEGYEPGKDFCRWLVHNTSTEFAYGNIRRALSCLDPGANYAGGGHAVPSYLTGKIESYRVKGADEDVRIEVEYADRIEGQPSKLKITAERWVLDE